MNKKAILALSTKQKKGSLMNIQEYSVALATSLESNKNPAAVAREVGTSQSTSSRFLKKLDLTDRDFIPFVRHMFGSKKLNLVVDDGVISKRYSEEIEGVSSMVDQSTKTFTNGYKIVVAGLTDGKYFLPIAIEQWIAEFIKAKTTTSVIYKGKKMQLQDCPDLRLNSNQNQKKIVANWNGQKWYFIAVRRSGKRGPRIIYLIANFNTKSRLYAKIYDSRWKIEKFFRTGKQSLGLSSSFSLEAKIYLNHMKCVFFAYCLLQLLMKKLKLNSIEDAIRKARSLKYNFGFAQTTDRISLLENYA